MAKKTVKKAVKKTVVKKKLKIVKAKKVTAKVKPKVKPVVKLKPKAKSPKARLKKFLESPLMTLVMAPDPMPEAEESPLSLSEDFEGLSADPIY